MSPVVNTEFPVNKNFQGNFLHVEKTLPSHSVFNLTLSNLNGFSSLFFESARNIIPDIAASLEYFSSAGNGFILLSTLWEVHYTNSHALQAILHTVDRFPSLHDHRNKSGHLCLLRIFYIAGETSPFSHGRYLYLQKWIWCALNNTASFRLVLFCTPS